MSVHEHKAEAPTSVKVQVVVVSTSRNAGSDRSGVLIAERLQAAGHLVLGRQVIPDDKARVQATIKALASDGSTEAILVTGGTGISARDLTPEALAPLFDRALPGFGELFRWLSYEEIGSAAMLSRAVAGVVGQVLVFAMPGSTGAVKLAVDKLILPELGHLLRELRKEKAPEAEVQPEVDLPLATDEEGEEIEVEILDDDGLPPPTGTLGRLGMADRATVVQQSLDEVAGEDAELADGAPVPYGWLRAVREIGGEILREEREELPWELEKIAPVVNVLETAGEQAVLKLPSGVKYSLWGWPDLQRPQAKVIAVGWGEPLAEVLALHRYPVMTGTCIVEERGLLPGHGSPVEATCEAVTGRAPRDTSGEVFAVDGQAVYIQRGSTVYKWDGRKDTSAGSVKQALATLMIGWSNR